MMCKGNITYEKPNKWAGLNPLGVATFNRYEELPENYAKYLPSEEEIIKRIGQIKEAQF